MVLSDRQGIISSRRSGNGESAVLRLLSRSTTGFANALLCSIRSGHQRPLDLGWFLARRTNSTPAAGRRNAETGTVASRGRRYEMQYCDGHLCEENPEEGAFNARGPFDGEGSSRRSKQHQQARFFTWTKFHPLRFDGLLWNSTNPILNSFLF